VRDDGEAVSQESIEIVRAHYASFSRLGERDEIHCHVRGYFDANCEYRPVEEIDAIRGHDALIGWIERWLEAWSSFHIDVEEITDGGELIVAAINTSGRGRTSDVEIRQRFFHVFEIRDGRILRQLEYLDRDSAVEAAGLSE
jgi:ketosteroid isomerase-like protein